MLIDTDEEIENSHKTLGSLLDTRCQDTPTTNTSHVAWYLTKVHYLIYLAFQGPFLCCPKSLAYLKQQNKTSSSNTILHYPLCLRLNITGNLFNAPSLVKNNEQNG